MKGSKERKIVDLLGRKKIIIAFITLIIFLVITTIILFTKALQQNQDKVETIRYTESSQVDYKVFINENDFFEGEYIGKDRQYIASLINYVNATFKYNLKSSQPNVTHNYKYKIDAVINVEDENNQNSIYKFTENLVGEKILQFNTNNKLAINETVNIDYNKYNNIIKKFINVYNLRGINSTITLNMYVNVEGVSNSSRPVASLVIPLTTQTVAIDIQSNSVNATEINVYKEIANKNYLYTAILTFILTIMIIIELYVFKNNTKDDLTIYQSKVKKVLLNYGSYVQKINNEFDFEEFQQLEMETFDDILQVRDTIGQPILMKENEKINETVFFLTSGSVVYTYKIKKEDSKKNQTKTKKSKSNKEG